MQMRSISKLGTWELYTFQSVHANTLRQNRAYGPGAYFGLRLLQNSLGLRVMLIQDTSQKTPPIASRGDYCQDVINLAQRRTAQYYATDGLDSR